MRPDGPVSVVTGAGSGIGRATVIALSRLGHRVVLVGRRADPLAGVAGELPGAADTMLVAADVSNPVEVARMIDAAVDRFGRLDALVNNAGAAPLAPIERHTPELIESTFRVNALASAWATAQAWPIFARQRTGCVVNVASLAARDPFQGFFAYAASKAAVAIMARSCAVEGAAIGVRAFCVAPGAVETPMLRALFTPDQIPTDKCLAPEAVAGVIVECIRGARDHENGQTIWMSA